jgi:hypothetical protein
VGHTSEALNGKTLEYKPPEMPRYALFGISIGIQIEDSPPVSPIALDYGDFN